MRLTPLRRGTLNTSFVLMLVLCLSAFAIYLKVSVPYTTPPGNSHTQVKFWVKTAGSQNTRVKLAAVDVFVLVPPPAAAIILHDGFTAQPAPAFIPPLKDAFAESGYWFRPPPLS